MGMIISVERGTVRGIPLAKTSGHIIIHDWSQTYTHATTQTRTTTCYSVVQSHNLSYRAPQGVCVARTGHAPRKRLLGLWDVSLLGILTLKSQGPSGEKCLLRPWRTKALPRMPNALLWWRCPNLRRLDWRGTKRGWLWDFMAQVKDAAFGLITKSRLHHFNFFGRHDLQKKMLTHETVFVVYTNTIIVVVKHITISLSLMKISLIIMIIEDIYTLGTRCSPCREPQERLWCWRGQRRTNEGPTSASSFIPKSEDVKGIYRWRHSTRYLPGGFRASRCELKVGNFDGGFRLAWQQGQ